MSGKHPPPRPSYVPTRTGAPPRPSYVPTKTGTPPRSSYVPASVAKTGTPPRPSYIPAGVAKTGTPPRPSYVPAGLAKTGTPPRPNYVRPASVAKTGTPPGVAKTGTPPRPSYVPARTGTPPRTGNSGATRGCKQPQGKAKPVLKHEKQPKICPFPGYEQKDASSIPLVVPDDFEYDAGSSELKKIDKTLRRSKLVPCSEALKLLESIEKPVSVLTICGPARGGKSYILSRILGRPGAFKLGHTMRAQTYGVWMGTHYLDFGDYAMLLFDTEGTDAVGAKDHDDISILLLATLLSSCLIYNSKNVPTEGDLKTMEWFTRLSSVITINSMKERVQESEYGDMRRLFPDFLWLLRDVMLQLPEKKKGQPMTPMEFLLDEVFEKNREVGKALKSFFATVDCSILPTPVASLHESDESSLEGQNHHFFKEVQKFIAYIHGKARAKNGFQMGERVDGPILSMLVDSYVEAINDPRVKPCIETSWQSVVQMRCSQVIADLVKEYEDEMQEELTNKLPMEISPDPENPEQPFLWQIHGDVHRRISDKLREATKYYMPANPKASETERKELSDQLDGKIIQIEQSGTKVRVVGGVACTFFEENEKMSHEHCVQVFDEVSQKLYERIKTAEYDPTTTESLEDAMQEEVKWLQVDYYEKAVGPAKEEVLEIKLTELEEYGSRVAGLQKRMHDREALAEKRHHEEIKALQAATDEKFKTKENEFRKTLEEHDERTKRVRDDLERQIHDERMKRKELDIAHLNTVTQLGQKLDNVKKEQAATALKHEMEAKSLRHEMETTALRQQLEAEQIKRETILKIEEEIKQKEAALAMQAPKHVQNRKINLPDEDKKMIAEAWFGYMPEKDLVKSEAKRLKLGAPRFGSIGWRSEEAWIKYFGEQLYIEDLVMLKKTYDIEDSDIVVYKK